jgi:hypothetical protein
MRRKGPQAMSLERQSVLLKGYWRGKTRARGDTLIWHGVLQPTPFSSVYRVRIQYRHRHRPRVAILEPALDPGEHVRLPHVYNEDDLCLYTAGEWNSSMALATTIVPWSAEWLFYYEAWRVTGLWHGGGETYAPKTPDDTADLDAG